jgi:hypothetical protein
MPPFSSSPFPLLPSPTHKHPPQGSKVFLVAPPLPTNLAAFESWARSKRQSRTWLGRVMQGVTQVTLQPGDTLLLPPGEPWQPHTSHNEVERFVILWCLEAATHCIMRRGSSTENKGCRQ